MEGGREEGRVDLGVVGEIADASDLLPEVWRADGGKHEQERRRGHGG